MNNQSDKFQVKTHQTRNHSLDVIRVVACILVVLMHSPRPVDNANGLFLSSLSYFTAPCIGLFFMVSGALLLPVDRPLIPFLKKRFGKIIFPTLFWTIIYLIFKLFFSQSEVNIIRSLYSIPFSPQGHGVLWFMYTLAGLYLLAPILSGWLQNTTKKEIEFVLLLWCVTLCYPIIGLFADISTGITGPLYYFSGYAGYFLLGYYANKWPNAIKWKILLPFVLISIIAPVICKASTYNIDFYTLFWYLSIFVVILSLAIFKFANQHLTKVNLTTVSNYTFGIYLCHIMIMRFFIWKMPCIINIENYPIQTFAIAAITIVLSFALCWGIGYLPFGDYIIGFRRSVK